MSYPPVIGLRISPDVGDRLREESKNTGAPMAFIVENLLRKHYKMVSEQEPSESVEMRSLIRSIVKEVLKQTEK